ncbi:hypothetical protein BJ875DRAFT_457744 [Amylocarpus encephaloides]|uniref:Uncharacterized protein n=1 Tax=Amylocarpus encephaloides TaxID=45428 RepID=A0A9P7YLD4_9HELO|nr:hypothetical protein BJ875DRAFT_457744 [Amylocarpus encephaloides]
MQSFTSITTLLLLSFLQVILAGPISFVPELVQLGTRQTTTTVSCAEYSMDSNYTVIGTNSTYRAAFIQASPAGTDPTTSILDTATKKFMDANMMMDKALNAECGNLSALAMKEAPVNFTNGIVGPFTIKKASAGTRVGSGLGSVVVVATMVGAALWL